MIELKEVIKRLDFQRSSVEKCRKVACIVCGSYEMFAGGVAVDRFR